MLKTIRGILLNIVNDIDCGNTSNSEEELIQIAKVLQSYTDKTKRISKYEAMQILGVSRATFDNYVRAGKIPEGQRQIGFKEKFWDLKEIEDFKKLNK